MTSSKNDCDGHIKDTQNNTLNSTENPSSGLLLDEKTIATNVHQSEQNLFDFSDNFGTTTNSLLGNLETDISVNNSGLLDFTENSESSRNNTLLDFTNLLSTQDKNPPNLTENLEEKDKTSFEDSLLNFNDNSNQETSENSLLDFSNFTDNSFSIPKTNQEPTNSGLLLDILDFNTSPIPSEKSAGNFEISKENDNINILDFSNIEDNSQNSKTVTTDLDIFLENPATKPDLITKPTDTKLVSFTDDFTMDFTPVSSKNVDLDTTILPLGSTMDIISADGNVDLLDNEIPLVQASEVKTADSHTNDLQNNNNAIDVLTEERPFASNDFGSFDSDVAEQNNNQALVDSTENTNANSNELDDLVLQNDDNVLDVNSTVVQANKTTFVKFKINDAQTELSENDMILQDNDKISVNETTGIGADHDNCDFSSPENNDNFLNNDLLSLDTFILNAPDSDINSVNCNEEKNDLISENNDDKNLGDLKDFDSQLINKSLEIVNTSIAGALSFGDNFVVPQNNTSLNSDVVSDEINHELLKNKIDKTENVSANTENLLLNDVDTDDGLNLKFITENLDLKPDIIPELQKSEISDKADETTDKTQENSSIFTNASDKKVVKFELPEDNGILNQEMFSNLGDDKPMSGGSDAQRANNYDALETNPINTNWDDPNLMGKDVDSPIKELVLKTELKRPTDENLSSFNNKNNAIDDPMVAETSLELKIDSDLEVNDGAQNNTALDIISDVSNNQKFSGNDDDFTDLTSSFLENNSQVLEPTPQTEENELKTDATDLNIKLVKNQPTDLFDNDESEVSEEFKSWEIVTTQNEEIFCSNVNLGCDQESAAKNLGQEDSLYPQNVEVISANSGSDSASLNLLLTDKNESKNDNSNIPNNGLLETDLSKTNKDDILNLNNSPLDSCDAKIKGGLTFDEELKIDNNSTFLEPTKNIKLALLEDNNSSAFEDIQSENKFQNIVEIGSTLEANETTILVGDQQHSLFDVKSMNSDINTGSSKINEINPGLIEMGTSQPGLQPTEQTSDYNVELKESLHKANNDVTFQKKENMDNTVSTMVNIDLGEIDSTVDDFTQNNESYFNDNNDDLLEADTESSEDNLIITGGQFTDLQDIMTSEKAIKTNDEWVLQSETKENIGDNDVLEIRSNEVSVEMGSSICCDENSIDENANQKGENNLVFELNSTHSDVEQKVEISTDQNETNLEEPHLGARFVNPLFTRGESVNKEPVSYAEDSESNSEVSTLENNEAANCIVHNNNENVETNTDKLDSSETTLKSNALNSEIDSEPIDKQDPVPETGPESELNKQPEFKQNNKPDSALNYEPDSVPITEPGTVAKNEPDFEKNIKSESEPDIEPDSKPSNEPDPVPNNVPDSKSNNEADLVPNIEPKTNDDLFEFSPPMAPPRTNKKSTKKMVSNPDVSSNTEGDDVSGSFKKDDSEIEPTNLPDLLAENEMEGEPNKEPNVTLKNEPDFEPINESDSEPNDQLNPYSPNNKNIFESIGKPDSASKMELDFEPNIEPNFTPVGELGSVENTMELEDHLFEFSSPKAPPRSRKKGTKNQGFDLTERVDAVEDGLNFVIVPDKPAFSLNKEIDHEPIIKTEPDSLPENNLEFSPENEPENFGLNNKLDFKPNNKLELVSNLDFKPVNKPDVRLIDEPKSDSEKSNIELNDDPDSELNQEPVDKPVGTLIDEPKSVLSELNIELNDDPDSEPNQEPNVEPVNKLDLINEPKSAIVEQNIKLNDEPHSELNQEPVNKPDGKLIDEPESVLNEPNLVLDDEPDSEPNQEPLNKPDGKLVDEPKSVLNEKNIELNKEPDSEPNQEPDVEPVNKPDVKLIDELGSVLDEPDIVVNDEPDSEPNKEPVNKPDGKLTDEPESVLDKPNIVLNDKPDSEPNQEPDVKPVNKPDGKLRDEPQSALDEQNIELNDEPDSESNQEPDVKAVNKPDVELTNEPKLDLDNPNIESDFKPNKEPISSLNIEPDAEPETFSEHALNKEPILTPIRAPDSELNNDLVSEPDSENNKLDATIETIAALNTKQDLENGSNIETTKNGIDSESESAESFGSDHMNISDLESSDSEVYIDENALEFDDNPFEFSPPKAPPRTSKKATKNRVPELVGSRNAVSDVLRVSSVPSSVFIGEEYMNNDQNLSENSNTENTFDIRDFTQEITLTQHSDFLQQNMSSREQDLNDFDSDWDFAQNMKPVIEMLPVIEELSEPESENVEKVDQNVLPNAIDLANIDILLTSPSGNTVTTLEKSNHPIPSDKNFDENDEALFFGDFNISENKTNADSVKKTLDNGHDQLHFADPKSISNELENIDSLKTVQSETNDDHKFLLKKNNDLVKLPQANIENPLNPVKENINAKENSGILSGNEELKSNDFTNQMVSKSDDNLQTESSKPLRDDMVNQDYVADNLSCGKDIELEQQQVTSKQQDDILLQQKVQQDDLVLHQQQSDNVKQQQNEIQSQQDKILPQKQQDEETPQQNKIPQQIEVVQQEDDIILQQDELLKQQQHTDEVNQQQNEVEQQQDEVVQQQQHVKVVLQENDIILQQDELVLQQQHTDKVNQQQGGVEQQQNQAVQQQDDEKMQQQDEDVQKEDNFLLQQDKLVLQQQHTDEVNQQQDEEEQQTDDLKQLQDKETPQQDEILQQQQQQDEVVSKQDDIILQQDELLIQQQRTNEINLQQNEVEKQQDEVVQQQQDEVVQQQKDEVVQQQDDLKQQQNEVSPQQEEILQQQHDKKTQQPDEILQHQQDEVVQQQKDKVVSKHDDLKQQNEVSPQLEETLQQQHEVVQQQDDLKQQNEVSPQCEEVLQEQQHDEKMQQQDEVVQQKDDILLQQNELVLQQQHTDEVKQQKHKIEHQQKDNLKQQQNEVPPQKDEIQQQHYQDEDTQQQEEILQQQQDDIILQQDELVIQQQHSDEVNQQQDQVKQQQDEVVHQQDDLKQQPDEVSPQRGEIQQQLQDKVVLQQQHDEIVLQQQDDKETQQLDQIVQQQDDINPQHDKLVLQQQHTPEVKQKQQDEVPPLQDKILQQQHDEKMQQQDEVVLQEDDILLQQDELVLQQQHTDEVNQQQNEVEQQTADLKQLQDEETPQQDEILQQQHDEKMQQQDEVVQQEDDILLQQDELLLQQQHSHEVKQQQDEIVQQQDEVEPQQHTDEFKQQADNILQQQDEVKKEDELVKQQECPVVKQQQEKHEVVQQQQDKVKPQDELVPQQQHNTILKQSDEFVQQQQQQDEEKLAILFALKSNEQQVNKPKSRVRYDTIGSIDLLSDSEDDLGDILNPMQADQSGDELISPEDDVDLFASPTVPPSKRRSIAPPSSLVLSIALDEDTPVGTPTQMMQEKIEEIQEEKIEEMEDVDLWDTNKNNVGENKEPLSQANANKTINSNVHQLIPPADINKNIVWETIVIDNEDYKVDGNAIQPYKRVISHGGFYKDKQTIVEIFGNYLPDNSIPNYTWIIDNLFLYLLSTMQLLVQDKKYVVIFFNNSVPKSRYPSSGWLKKSHLQISRTLRKNLTGFYIVQPSFYLKTLTTFCRAFVSRKAFKKVKHMKNHIELKQFIPTDFLFIPSDITGRFLHSFNEKKIENSPTTAWSWIWNR